MKTLAELKRYMRPGTTIYLTEKRGENGKHEARPIKKIQTNAWVFADADGKDNWLHIPPTSLLEITDAGFSVYEPALRSLTKKERVALGYCQKHGYFAENGYSYLRGYSEKGGMKYVPWEDRVRDNKVRGQKILVYSFK